MRTSILSLLVLSLSISAFGQIDSTILSTINSQSTKSEVISKYRGLIMDNIIENNKAKVKKLFYDAILKLDNDYYIAFYQSEKWLICFWLGDFDFITSEIVNTDSAKLARMYDKVKPKQDQLYSILKFTFDKFKDDISAKVNSSVMPSVADKEFLQLLLTTYTIPRDKNYQYSINSAATSYINANPNSKFENYVRNFIRYEYVPKNLQFGIEYYSGATFFNGKTTNYFKSSGNFGFGFIWGIDKFQLNTRAAFVFSRLNNDISNGTVLWKNDERALVILGEISIGYQIQLLRKVSVLPVVGIGWFMASPFETDIQKNPDLENVEINSKGAPIVGIDFCFNSSNINYYNYILNRQMNAFYSFNIRYMFQPTTFQKKYEVMNGQSHTITLSVKFGFGRSKRVF